MTTVLTVKQGQVTAIEQFACWEDEQDLMWKMERRDESFAITLASGKERAGRLLRVLAVLPKPVRKQCVRALRLSDFSSEALRQFGFRIAGAAA